MSAGAVKDVVDAGGNIRRLDVVHADPSKIELANDLARRYPTDPNASRAITDGRPQLIAERLNHVVRGDGYVRRPAGDHVEEGCEHAADGRYVRAVRITRRRQRVEVPIIERPDALLVRASTHFYNTPEEIDLLAEALRSLLV